MSTVYSLDLLVGGAARQQHQAAEQLLEGDAALLMAATRAVQPVGQHRRHTFAQHVLQEGVLAQRRATGAGRSLEGVADAPDLAVGD